MKVCCTSQRSSEHRTARGDVGFQVLTDMTNYARNLVQMDFLHTPPCSQPLPAKRRCFKPTASQKKKPERPEAFSKYSWGVHVPSLVGNAFSCPKTHLSRIRPLEHEEGKAPKSHLCTMKRVPSLP